VLLEIETDKAQMDVEAQEDGVLAKILVPDGTHNVKVGKPIAVFAEEGDDISLVEVSAENTENLSQTSRSTVGEPIHSKEERSLQTSQKKEASSKFAGWYSPSVYRLLQEYNVEDPRLIQPTGPQGRLLKGDVLAYVGNIDRDIPKQLKEALSRKQKLDLSNVTIKKAQIPLQLEAQEFVPSPLEPAIPAQVATIVRLTRLLRLHSSLSGLLSVLGFTHL
jgi:pyruvate/2-oxoglutarate dehydrogenase complex dihydrolipoamide acyltransferase (E2) component